MKTAVLALCAGGFMGCLVEIIGIHSSHQFWWSTGASACFGIVAGLRAS
jgi:hypothetical protein